ncbi:MAG: hypothetical protein Q8R83_07635 [Legionellaceae bacterium]|nr:hypothetical protein [Legionellaceae bacterium]
MEPDRFVQDEKSYIVGILCLIISIGLFAFSFYLFPFLVLGWHYSIPEFIPIWGNDLQQYYQLSDEASSWLLFLVLFVPAIVFAVIADILSNRIDAEIHGIQPKRIANKEQDIAPIKESNQLIFKIAGIIVLVFIAARLFQWAISSTPNYS